MAYTDEELIEALQEADEEIDNLTCDVFEALPDYPSGTAIKGHFGSWTKGCEAAGIGDGPITKKGILENIERLVEADEVSNSADFFDHPDTISKKAFYNRFDSWREVVDGLGVDVYGKHTDDDLIELLQEAEEEDILHLNSESFDKHSDYPSTATVRKRFGSWKNGCREAGVETGEVTRNGIIQSIEKFVEGGEISSSQDFFDHPETASPNGLYGCFDAWREAVDEAGVGAFVNYTDEDIIEKIKEFHEEFGYVSLAEFDSSDEYPSKTAAINHFGSWNEAVEAAGIEPNKPTIEMYKEEPTRRKERFGTNWREQREKALERDDFECRKCGDEESLQVHHRKPRYTYRDSDVLEIEESNRLHNLVTLCKTCHWGVEADEPCPNRDPEVLYPRLV